MSRFAVARPSPDPRDLVVKKAVKIRSRMSAGMPGPVSVTETWLELSTALIATSILPRPCIACALFTRRFWK